MASELLLTRILSIIGTITGIFGLLLSLLALNLNRRDKRPRLKILINHEVMSVNIDAFGWDMPPEDAFVITIVNPTLLSIEIYKIVVEFSRNNKKHSKEVSFENNPFSKTRLSLPITLSPLNKKILGADLESFSIWLDRKINNEAKIQVLIFDATRNKPYKSNKFKLNELSFYFR